MNIPDNYDQWETHERQKEKLLERLPVCEKCNEPIQDTHYFKINGEILCAACVNDRYRENTEDYYEGI